MLKYFVLLFNMIGLYFFQSILVDDISATISAPNKVKPGEDFTVEIIVKKGTLSGFAQVKIDLPEGLTAAPAADQSSGSEYKVTAQTIRFTWTSLPGDAELKLSFKVKAAADASGIKTIAGKFSYLNNGNKTAIETNKMDVMVGEEQPVTKTTTTNTENNTSTTNTTTTDNTTPPDNTSNNKSAPVNVTASRKVTRNAKPGDEFTVEISIFKGNLKGFSRFQDMLPEGLTATEGESKGGTFSFIDQKAKIVWDNVPSDEQFTITYKVKVANNAAGDLNFDGLFSYVENDEPKKVILAVSLITVERPEIVDNTNINTTSQNNTTTNTTQDNTTNTTNNTTTQDNTTTTQNTTNNNTQDNSTNTNTTQDNTTTTQNTTNNNTSNNNTTNTTDNSNTNTSTSTNTKTDNSSSNNNQENTVTNVTPPSTGISYRVQICASHSEPVGSWYFSSMYGIQDNVKVEAHEGWNKYTVGKYSQYKEARDYREVMRGKGVSGAFVTAYNQGTRVTVQEALMTSGQQWYK